MDEVGLRRIEFAHFRGEISTFEIDVHRSGEMPFRKFLRRPHIENDETGLRSDQFRRLFRIYIDRARRRNFLRLDRGSRVAPARSEDDRNEDEKQRK